MHGGVYVTVGSVRRCFRSDHWLLEVILVVHVILIDLIIDSSDVEHSMYFVEGMIYDFTYIYLYFFYNYTLFKGTNKPKCSVQKLFTLLGHFVFEKFRNMSKNILKPCYHIESNTTNPNPILKDTICFTKYPPKPKYFQNTKK